MAFNKRIFTFTVLRDGISKSQYYSMFIQYLSMAISLCSLFITSKLYGFEAVGIFVFYLATQQIVSFAATLGVSNYSIRAFKRTVNQRRIILLLSQHAGIVFILGAIAVLLNILIKIQDGSDFAILIAACWFGLVRYMVEDVSAALGWFIRSSFVALVENSIRFLMLLLIGIQSPHDALLILLMATAITIVIMGYSVVRHCAAGRGALGGFAYHKIYYRNSLLMFFSHLCGLFQNRVGVLTAPHILSATEAGVFAILISLSEVALRIGGMVSRFIFASASSRVEQYIHISPIALVSSVTLIGGMISAFMLGGYPILNSYFYHGELVGYFSSFFILCIYSTVFLYFNLSSNLLYGRGDSVEVMLSSVSGVLVTLLTIGIAWVSNSFIVLCCALAAGALSSSMLNARSLRMKLVSLKEITN